MPKTTVTTGVCLGCWPVPCDPRVREIVPTKCSLSRSLVSPCLSGCEVSRAAATNNSNVAVVVVLLCGHSSEKAVTESGKREKVLLNQISLEAHRVFFLRTLTDRRYKSDG